MLIQNFITIKHLIISVIAMAAVPCFAQNQTQKNAASGNRVVFSWGFSYNEDRREDDNQSSQVEGLTDLRLGYQWRQGWYLGLYYGYEQEKIKANDYPVVGLYRDSRHTRVGYGLTGGYVYGSFYGMFNYLPICEWELRDVSTTSVFRGGSGYQIDFGINFEFFGSPNFLLGPRLSYKYAEYSKEKTSSSETELKPKLKRTALDPYFILWFEF